MIAQQEPSDLTQPQDFGRRRITKPVSERWIHEHAGDVAKVGMINLMVVVGRLQQIADDDPIRESLIDRLVNSDLPRLRDCLPAEALVIIDEELKG